MNSLLREPDIDVVIAEDAVPQLTAYAVARGWPKALLVMDPNTELAVGRRVALELRQAGILVEELLFGRRLEATEAAVSLVRRHLRARVHPVVVGSGVITDIVRYAAHLEDRDFVSVPTAASMDGYASGVAVLKVDGVKVTYPARPPEAIFADPRVSAAAPPELARSGIGDLLAKATARIDWLAAHLLYGEPFSEEVAARVLRPLSYAAERAAAVISGETDTIRGLLSGLIESGIAMAIVGSSRPASGCEHHASHFWDLLTARGMRPHAPHGLQVGYATRFAMRLQQFAFNGGVETVRPPDPPANPLGADAREWLGEPSGEIIAAVAEKRRFIARGTSDWVTRWDAVRAQLAPGLELFGEVGRALTVAGIPAEPGFVSVDERTLRATFHYASRLRARYTVIDFLEGQGALDDAIDAMLAPG